jgi:hypothetical protein
MICRTSVKLFEFCFASGFRSLFLHREQAFRQSHSTVQWLILLQLDTGLAFFLLALEEYL